MEAVRLGLEYGENTSLDVFKAQQEIAEADKELTKIYYELFQSYIELIHLTGQFNNKKYISLIKNSFQWINFCVIWLLIEWFFLKYYLVDHKRK